MPYRYGQQGTVSGLQPINVKLCISLHPETKPRPPPPPPPLHTHAQNKDQWHTPASWGINKIPWAVEKGLLQEAHQCAKDPVQGDSQSRSIQARLGMYFVRHSIPYQFTTTWQHPQRWTKTGNWSILHQPSLQHVHGGQRSSSGGTSVEAVHELQSENTYLHWQPCTSCATWIWPNHKRSASS